ncbi:MAG: hypothetical protein E7378_01215 [Clostridiales bacterium]|nr:hypothetical protein [Clostridiales bacterium]
MVNDKFFGIKMSVINATNIYNVKYKYKVKKTNFIKATFFETATPILCFLCFTQMVALLTKVI